VSSCWHPTSSQNDARACPQRPRPAASAGRADYRLVSAGPHVLRVFRYPLVIGVLEAAQTICFAVAASQLRQRATSRWSLFGLFALFPATFFGVNFGAGSPVIIAIHAAHASQVAVYLCTLLSIVFAVTLVRFAAAFVPGSEPAGVPSQRHQASSPARAAVPGQPA